VANGWLDDEEQTAWRGLLAVIATLERDLDAQLRRDSGMPHAYYMVLVALEEHRQDGCRMSTLAELTLSSQSRVSHAVARLEERGWVRRERSDADGRGTLARLTDDGARALREAAPGHVAQVRRTVFDHLSRDQVHQLAAIAAAITKPDAG
jgi:DNA-binding MarR family transcriptional regulator